MDNNKDRMLGHYNGLYAETRKQDEPTKLVRRLLDFMQRGKALDLGAGDGRNSLFLGENGFEVTARDQATEGVAKINTLAQEKGLPVTAEEKDVRDFTPGESFDVIISTYVLHHLTRQEAEDLVRLMQEHTSDNGINLICAYREGSDHCRTDRDVATHFYPHAGEIKEWYKDWEILEYTEEQAVRLRDPDGVERFNIKVQLLARKKK